MNEKFTTFADVIGLWKSAETLADEIGAYGVTVRQWRNRDNIPSEYWDRIVKASSKLSVKVSTSDLASIAARKAPPMKQVRQ